jgi:RNA polymerase sigma factor (sigma-70 family)
MHDKSDAQLLRDYVEHGSEDDFRELVRRYTDMVFSAALRQVNFPDAARDVAQSVFTDLATKARLLVEKSAGETELAGWLFRSARFAALNESRNERRRLVRERQAMEQSDAASSMESEWERMRPVLDAAMTNLNEEDHNALLLRFFKERDFRAIGKFLGVSDDAAQKRVSRALEKLRAEFARRGITTTVGALSLSLSSNAVTLAPAGLAAALSNSALAGTAVVSAAAATTVIKALTLNALQKTIVALAIAGIGIAIPTVIIQRNSTGKLHQENISLRRQLNQTTAANETLSREAAQIAKPSLSSDEFHELLRLRDEVGRLRAQANEIVALRQENTRLQKLAENSVTPVANATKEKSVSSPEMPAGAINFINTHFRQVLAVYSALADTELEIPDHIERTPVSITFSNAQPMSRSEVLSELEKAILDQAGIQIIHTETNRAVVQSRK